MAPLLANLYFSAGVFPTRYKVGRAAQESWTKQS